VLKASPCTNATPEILRKIVYLNKCFRQEIRTYFKSIWIKSFQVHIPEKDSKRCGDERAAPFPAVARWLRHSLCRR